MLNALRWGLFFWYTQYVGIYFFKSPQDLLVTLEIQEKMVWQENRVLRAQMVFLVSVAAVVLQ